MNSNNMSLCGIQNHILILIIWLIATSCSGTNQLNNSTNQINSQLDEQLLSSSELKPEQFGAKGDGRTDDWHAFQKCLDIIASQGGSLITSNKKYHISKPILIVGFKSNRLTWYGGGAILDNTVEIRSPHVTIKDLTVRNSPNSGFLWTRGQGGFFENLKAEQCKEIGFQLGGEEGAQVAWANFHGLISTENKIGFALDGSKNKSWVNANIFTGCVMRKNQGAGLLIKGTANYNTFNGLQVEGNSTSLKEYTAVEIYNGIDNCFIGGHFVSNRTSLLPVVKDRGSGTTYFGGRYVAMNAKLESAVQVPESALKLNRRVSYDKVAKKNITLKKDRSLD